MFSIYTNEVQHNRSDVFLIKYVGGKKIQIYDDPTIVSSQNRTGRRTKKHSLHPPGPSSIPASSNRTPPPAPLPKTISCVWHMLSLVSELENNNVNVINSDCTSCSGTLRVKGHFTHWTSSQSILTQQPLSYSPTRVDPSLNTFLSWGWTGAFWEIIKHRWKG